MWYLADIKSDDEPSDPTPDPPKSNCGAYVAPGVWKQFDCYNLAAIGKTTDDDPFTPSWRLIGGYWQWGRKGPEPSLWHYTNTPHFAHGPTGPEDSEANDGEISGWDNPAPDGAWTDSYKTTNDPCPPGYRVPTRNQWDGVLDNNTQSTDGAWTEADGGWTASATNYSSALFLGENLMLPAAGDRSSSSGTLGLRGRRGNYWSSSEVGSDTAWNLHFNIGSAEVLSGCYRLHGHSVRCVAE